MDQGTIQINYAPGKPGQPVQVVLEPNVSGVKLLNTSVTGKAHTKNTFKMERARGENTIKIEGSLPVDAKKGNKKVAIDAPQVYTGEVFKEQLGKVGVHVDPHSVVKDGEKPSNARLIHTYYSPKLAEIVRYMNHYNNNFTAEMILRTLGNLGGGSGSFTDGIDGIQQLMRTQHLSSLFDMMDGSGLTRYTQISAEQITGLLVAETKMGSFSDFYPSLAVAGEKGVLAQLLGEEKSTKLTGILEERSDMQGLSGYVRTNDGDLLAYSLLLNGYSPTSQNQLIRQFAERLVEIANRS